MLCVNSETVEPWQKVQWVYLFLSEKIAVSSYCSSPGWKIHLSSSVRSSSCFSCMSVQSCSFDWDETTVTLLYWKKIQILSTAICTNLYLSSVHEQKPSILGCVFVWGFFQWIKGLKKLIVSEYRM